jgi:hypothetical protein
MLEIVPFFEPMQPKFANMTPIFSHKFYNEVKQIMNLIQFRIHWYGLKKSFRKKDKNKKENSAKSGKLKIRIVFEIQLFSGTFFASISTTLESELKSAFFDTPC